MLSRHALPAALSQEDVELEVVVVDDGSRDETASRLGGVRDPRIRIIRHDTPRGLPSARNTGIGAASGSWIAFLDDDDLWSPQKLRVQLGAAQANGASVVYAGGVMLDEELQLLHRLPATPADAAAEQLLWRNLIPAGASNVMATTESIRSVGGFDERLSHLADWDMWIRLTKAHTVAVSSEVVVGYLLHGHNMLIQDSSEIFREAEELAAKHRPPGAADVPLDLVWVAQWVAWTHRRAGDRKGSARALLRGGVRWRSLALLAQGAREEVLRFVALLRGGHRVGTQDEEPRVSAPEWVDLYRAAP